MGATFILYTRRINDLISLLSINLLSSHSVFPILFLALKLPYFPSKLYLPPSCLSSPYASFALLLIPHLYVRGLEYYTSSAEKCSIWFRNYSSVKQRAAGTTVTLSRDLVLCIFSPKVHLNQSAVTGKRHKKEQRTYQKKKAYTQW